MTQKNQKNQKNIESILEQLRKRKQNLEKSGLVCAVARAKELDEVLKLLENDVRQPNKEIEAISLAIGCFSDVSTELASYIARDVRGLNALKEDNKKRALKHISNGIGILVEIGWKIDEMFKEGDEK